MKGLLQHIKNIVKKIIALKCVSYLLDLASLLSLDKNERKFIKHNKSIWSDFIPKSPKNIIIADIFEVEELMLVYSYFANILAKKHNAKIARFIYGHNRFSRKFGHIYKSFNADSLIRVILNNQQKQEVDEHYQRLSKSMKKKSDLFNFHLEYCHLGIDIYESYLREYNQCTVYLKDYRLQIIIKAGITNFVFWRDFFKKNSVAACLATHDCYVWTNVICKVAYQNNVPVYLPNPRGATYATKPFSIQACYKNYPKIFSLLSEEERNRALQYSEERLKKRFSGAAGVDMFYSTAASFGEKTQHRVIKESNNIKVLVATHCFYDNPHAFEILPFHDFYDWMNFLGEISKETNYEWYVKIHPDPLQGTEEIIQDFIKKYPNFKYIPYTVKHNQLIEEGIDAVLTCYGSIGEEYPYYDKLVVNTGYNPRISYQFNVHSNSIQEYRHNILNIPKLIKDNKVDKNQLYEFYYVHNVMNWVDDMVFNSYYQFFKTLTDKERRSGRVYEYFLAEYSEKSHLKRIKRFENFLHSGKKNLFSIGPVE